MTGVQTCALPIYFEILETGRIGKRFTLQYVLETLYHWQKLSVWNSLYKMVQGRAAGRLELPINLHDNIFMLARKRSAQFEPAKTNRYSQPLPCAP